MHLLLPRPLALPAPVEAKFQAAVAKESLLFLFAFIGLQLACVVGYAIIEFGAGERSNIPIFAMVVTLCLHCCVAGVLCYHSCLADKPHRRSLSLDASMLAMWVLDTLLLALSRADVQHYLHYQIEGLPSIFWRLAEDCEADGESDGATNEDLCLLQSSNAFHAFALFWMVYFALCVLQYKHASFSVVLSISAYTALSVLGKGSLHLEEPRSHGVVFVHADLLGMALCMLMILVSKRVMEQNKRAGFLELERQSQVAIHEKVLRCQAEFRTANLDIFPQVAQSDTQNSGAFLSDHSLLGVEQLGILKSPPYAPSSMSAPAVLTGAHHKFHHFMNKALAACESDAGNGDCLRSDALVWIEGHAIPCPLSRVVVGQKVLCYDSVSRIPKYANVLDVCPVDVDACAAWVAVRLEDGTVLEMTTDHPVHVFNSESSQSPVGCLRAADLKSGCDKVMVLRMTQVPVLSVTQGASDLQSGAHAQWMKFCVEQPERHMCFVTQGGNVESQQTMAVGSSDLLPTLQKHNQKKTNSAPPSLAHGPQSARSSGVNKDYVHLSIHLLSGAVIDVEIPSDNRIADLQKLLSVKLQVPMDCVRLTAGIATLKAEQTVADIHGQALSITIIAQAPYLYACGGQTDNVSSMVYQLNMQTMQWRTLPPMTSQRTLACATVFERYLYVCGGRNGVKSLKSIERFNLDSEVWEQLPAMREERYGAVMVAMGGFLYFCGGFMKNRPVSTVMRFDPRTLDWEEMPPMLGPRGNASAVVLGGRLVVCGGHNETEVLSTVESFDPNAGLWEHFPPMLERRAGSGIALLDGFVYVAGGHNGIGDLSSAERYEPSQRCWTCVPAMHQPCMNGGAVAHAGEFYVCTTALQGSGSPVQCLDLHSGTWDYISCTAPLLGVSHVAWAVEPGRDLVPL